MLDDNKKNPMNEDTSDTSEMPSTEEKGGEATYEEDTEMGDMSDLGDTSSTPATSTDDEE